MRPLLLIPLMLFGLDPGGLLAASTVIREDRLSRDISDQVKVLKDPGDSISLDHILQKGRSLTFQKTKSKSPDLSFSNTGYWVRFRIRNNAPHAEDFLLEAARPITNRVDLYTVRNEKIIDTMRAGDHTPYHKKPYDHRKAIFPLKIPPGETRSYFLNLKSHGETIMLPLILRDPTTFHQMDRDRQFLNGIYYGVMVLVFVLFSFFYWVSRESSFLFYVLWVLSIGFSQMSVDGYSYRWLFSNAPWLADRAVLTTTIISIFFVSLYAKDYLKTRERSLTLDRIYKGILGLSLLAIATSLTNGQLYVITHPFINALSFFTAIFILISIIVLKRMRYRIPLPFTLAFIFLITGVTLFLLGNTGIVQNTVFFKNALKFGSITEIFFLSITMALKYREVQEEKEKAQAEALQELEEKKAIVDRHNRELEQRVAERTEALNNEKEKLAARNQEILSSIRYARRIQEAVLPSEKRLSEHFSSSFVLLKPRDQVSGDFYWLRKDPEPSNAVYFAAVDCTGHGVPGAFLSLMGKDILDRGIREPGVDSPSTVLDHLDNSIRETLLSGNADADNEMKDGMDLALCKLDQEKRSVRFAGANNPLYIIRDGELIELKGNKRAIGRSLKHTEEGFTEQHYKLQKGDTLFLFSDGYADQFGGEHGKKFKYSRFKELLCSIQTDSMAEQKRILDETIEEWRNDLEQVDDILVLGLRIT